MRELLIIAAVDGAFLLALIGLLAAAGGQL
jgi:hypothetical protein